MVEKRYGSERPYIQQRREAVALVLVDAYPQALTRRQIYLRARPLCKFVEYSAMGVDLDVVADACKCGIPATFRARQEYL